MNYEITKSETNQVRLSEDRKKISVDVTIHAQHVNGDIKIPFTEGFTIENIPLSMGEKIPDEIDVQALKQFNDKYNKQS